MLLPSWGKPLPDFFCFTGEGLCLNVVVWILMKTLSGTLLLEKHLGTSENGDSLLGADDSGKGELPPLIIWTWNSENRLKQLHNQLWTPGTFLTQTLMQLWDLRCWLWILSASASGLFKLFLKSSEICSMHDVCNYASGLMDSNQDMMNTKWKHRNINVCCLIIQQWKSAL